MKSPLAEGKGELFTRVDVDTSMAKRGNQTRFAVFVKNERKWMRSFDFFIHSPIFKIVEK